MSVEAMETTDSMVADILQGLRRALVTLGPPDSVPGDRFPIRSYDSLAEVEVEIKGIEVKQVKNLTLTDALACGVMSMEELREKLGKPDDDAAVSVSTFTLVKR